MPIKETTRAKDNCYLLVQRAREREQLAAAAAVATKRGCSHDIAFLLLLLMKGEQ
jgi:hypothetical protein